ncbi:MAG: GNAT family N-acetyltransferase [Planctomycetes bacterium]|nr:GNAT family N-acetyltransferase [Planctomycetota bacterium]
MPDPLRLLALHSDDGVLVEPEWLARAEGVHRELRTQLEPDYPRQMQRVVRDGARMTIAIRDDRVVGVAVHRVYENTCDGRHLYVDDLVTAASARSSGVGRALLADLERRARAQGCTRMTLDSGTQRSGAHKFYFREGYVVSGFHFRKELA